MGFEVFKKAMQKHFSEMSDDVQNLFEVNLDKDRLWEIYLSSFPPKANPKFRERTEHDCSCCRHFIKSFGNVVTINEGVVTSVWDFEVPDEAYQTVANALSEYVHSFPVSDFYVSKMNNIGTDVNHEQTESGEVLTWEHFYIRLDNKFVDRSNRSEGDLKGSFRDIKNVFKRSLDEISVDSVETVLELIAQNSLYKGEEWQHALTEFLKYKREYIDFPEEKKDLFAWENAQRAGIVVGKIRNHSIGTLLVNISEGMELDTAVKKYEEIVAPSNYKRPKAIFTKKMLEEARNTVEELGYIDSLSRRYAKLSDITVNNILFSNKDSAKVISGNVFDEMAASVAVNPKKFSKVEEISINDFINNVLPTAKEVSLLLENRHTSNMVSLIAPTVPDSKTMFKWNNGYSWAYAGNVTDSLMKERVKAAGGKVDGVLRFSIQWNDMGSWDKNDLDAHCIEPNGNRIYYSTKVDRYTGGNLDVDIINPSNNVPAVENITWSDIEKMLNGEYQFLVHCYSNRGGVGGFRAEIEFDGQIYSFDYNKPVKQGKFVPVANVKLLNGVFSIEEKLPSSVSSRKIWGIDSNQFVPVSVIMYSPNYWDEQDGIGHRHVFFMLKDCKNDGTPNGFFNEYLKSELEKHKRVFEALGSQCRVEESDEQLSGVGFSTTKRNDVLVKVTGATQRVLRVKF